MRRERLRDMREMRLAPSAMPQRGNRLHVFGRGRTKLRERDHDTSIRF